jgi:CRISPR-associated protein Cmr6
MENSLFLKLKYINDNVSDDDIIRSNPRLLYYYFANGVKLKGNKRKEFLNKFKELSFPCINEYIDEIINQLRKESFNVYTILGKLKSKCIPGMGYINSLETGINLHFLYGFPYISSTTIKGIVSDYLIFYENKNKEDVEYKKIFGSQKNKGSVIIFDALPCDDKDLLTIDVMTPHFDEYYTKGKSPGDYLKPNPILFITIKEKVIFEFNFATKDKILGDKVISYLKGALENIGVGAKTSLGYGLFEIIEKNEK